MRISAAIIWASGAIAFPLLAAVTVLTLVDSVSSSIYRAGPAIAAATLNVVALGALTLIITIALRRGVGLKLTNDESWGVIAMPVVCGCFCLVAAAVTLAELAMNRQHAALKGDRTRMTIAIAMASGAAVAQAVFYILVCVAAGGSAVFRPQLAEIEPYAPHPKSLPLSEVHTTSREVFRNDEEKQSAFLDGSATSLHTMRSSITQAMRPTTSKTRLVRTPNTEKSQLSHSLRSSMDSLSRGDAFDRWDTSDIDSDTRDAVLSSGSRRPGALEPIPGSRPGSPGRPLEGPFPEHTSAAHESSPAIVEPTRSPHLSRPGTSQSHYTLYPYSRRNDSRVSIDSTRPSSPAMSEAHIHPLFRTDSPTPPPSHSANTVILASPRAGQVISPPPKAFSRMNSRETIRSGSQTNLVPSRSLTSDRVSLSSSAPPSRMPTPPIPDFVMGAPK